MPDTTRGPSRPTVDIRSAPGGWPDPWPNVEELARVLPSDKWTLIGGLMTQLHTIHHEIGAVRPTNDIDIVLHVETARGLPTVTAAALESLGYELKSASDPRNNTAHRFTRGVATIEVVTSESGRTDDTVDVVLADHVAPTVEETLRGKTMVRIEGGTQALKRTMNARIEITPGATTTISVPRPFGALVLKAAAYKADSRNPDRHLYDAAALLACIQDPYEERDRFAGSDRSRLLGIQSALPDDHAAWLPLSPEARRNGQAALRLLCAPA